MKTKQPTVNSATTTGKASAKKKALRIAQPDRNREPSQADVILSVLEKAHGQWVAMPRLGAVAESFNVHSRIDELRSRGFTIENRQDVRKESRKRNSYYRLVPAEETTKPADPT